MASIATSPEPNLKHSHRISPPQQLLHRQLLPSIFSLPFVSLCAVVWVLLSPHSGDARVHPTSAPLPSTGGHYSKVFLNNFISNTSPENPLYYVPDVLLIVSAHCRVSGTQDLSFYLFF